MFDEYNGTANGTENQAPKNEKVFYHYLNTKQSEDVMVFKPNNHPDWMWDYLNNNNSHNFNIFSINSILSSDGTYYCAIALEGTTKCRVFCSKLTPGQPITGLLNLTSIIDEPDLVAMPITIIGHQLYLLTDKNAPNKHVVVVDLNNPNGVSLTLFWLNSNLHFNNFLVQLENNSCWTRENESDNFSWWQIFSCCLH